MNSLFLSSLLHARLALGLVHLQDSADKRFSASVGSTLGAASTLASRTSTAMAAFSKVGVDMTYGLRPAEFSTLMESSWRSEATAETLAALGANDTHTARCQDAKPGSMCYHATEWLLAKGLAKYPTWYPSLSEGSLMQEVQGVLHRLGKAFCPRPCETRTAERLEQSPDDRVLEVDGNGRQVLSEAYRLSQPTECGDPVEGDWCYLSIVWLKNIGLAKHPDWYPTLARESSTQKFQAVLHNEGKAGCPLPCPSPDSAPARLATTTEPDGTARAVVSPSAMTIKEELQECRDATEGSSCYAAVTHVLDVGIWENPEEYPELATDCTFDEVQEHLYLRRQHECARPCPKAPITKHPRSQRVKKNPKDMTEKELVEFLNHEWDGYVDADEYSDTAAVLAPSSRENAFDQYTNAVAADSASPKEGASANDVSAAEADAAGECRDVSVGELCYQAVDWAKSVGVLERPKWYSGLSRNSTFKEFQAHLHKERGTLCPMPCPDAAEAPPARESATGDATGAQSDDSGFEGPATEIDNGFCKTICHRFGMRALGEKFKGVDDPVRCCDVCDEVYPERGGAASAEPGAQPTGDAVAANELEEPLPVIDGDGRELGSAIGEPAQLSHWGVSSDQPEVAAEGAPAEARQEPRPKNATEEANSAGGEANSTGGEEPVPRPDRDVREARDAAGEANSTGAEEPVLPPSAAAANSTAEGPAPQAEAVVSEEPLPRLEFDGRTADSAAQEPGPPTEANISEEVIISVDGEANISEADSAVETEANISVEPLPWLTDDEEPAPQQEAATVEANSSNI